MSRARVFVTQPIAPKALARLEQAADVRLNPDRLHIVRKDELVDAVREADVLFCLLHDAVDADVVAANPALRAIATMTITPANVDVGAATQRRIPVTVIPPIVTEATADLTWALLLSLVRRVAEADRAMRAGTFPGAQSRYFEGDDVSGATLGLLGAGRVGQAVARRARGFAMRVIYHDPQRLSGADETALGIEWVSFERLLAESDILSVHVDLGPATHHLIGAAELERMKPHAYLLNTARGPIVDERALVDALGSGRLAGAGLDVFEHEPLVPAELRTLPNVVLTPHVGSATRSLRERMAMVVVDNVLAVLDGRRAPNCWNPEIYG
jgi:glyoxylate reductase